jgi:ferredoxin
MPDGRSWTVSVDRERCMGTGTCMTYAAGTLVFDPEGKATVDEPITDDLDAVRAAVDSCPTQALAVVGDAT